MENFKTFLESEEQRNVKSIISKLPKKHQQLLDGFKVVFEPNNTLKNDNDNIGYIFKKKIVVAAPWNYGRSMVTLHEIAHLVWEKLMTSQLKKEWKKLVSSTIEDQKKNIPSRSVNALDQDHEEIFCMSYASTYMKHPPVTYLNSKWQDFITNKVPH